MLFIMQVVSDKDMVKLLQKEVSRLEAELRFTASSEVKVLLKQKDAEIQQVEDVIHYVGFLAFSYILMFLITNTAPR